MHGRRNLIGATIFAALVAGPVSGASACSSQLFGDPAGDSNAALAPVQLAGQSNEDLTGASISTNADGTGATVRIGIADLEKTVAAGASGEAWYFGYSVNGGNPVWVGAESDGASYRFSYGTVTGTTFVSAGGAGGSATEGAGGALSISLPGAAPGATLSGMWAEADREHGATLHAGSRSVTLSQLQNVDSASGGGSYVVGGC